MFPDNLSSGGRSPSRTRAWLVLCAMSMLQFFIAVDVTVVNIALPSIGVGFGVDGHALTWVVVGYTVTGGGMLMLGGRLGDLLGRRRVLLLGTGLFGAASLLAGLAPTFALLVVARLLQGAGEAVALPAAMGTIVLMFPEGPRRSRALSVWAAVASCGLVLGFALSGIITAHLGWRWIFLVSVPFILVVLLAAVFLVEGDRPVAKDTRPMDLPGALLLTACPLLFTFGVVEAGEPGRGRTARWVGGGTWRGFRQVRWWVSGAVGQGAGEGVEGCQGVGAGGGEDDAGRAGGVAGGDRRAGLVGCAGDAQFTDPGGGHGPGELPAVGAGGTVCAQFGGEGQGVEVCGPARLADRLQPGADAGEGGFLVVVDGRGVVGDDLRVLRGGRGAEVVQGGGDVGGGGGFGQEESVGDLARGFLRPGAADAQDDRRDAVGGLGEDDAFTAHVAAVGGAGLTGEEPAQRACVLLDQRQGAGGPGAGLAHPVGHAVTDADDEAAGVELGEGGQLHRGEAHVAGTGGQNADSDGEVRGGGQDGGRLGDAAAPAEVLHHPDLLEPQLLGTPRVRQHVTGGKIAGQHDSGTAAGGLGVGLGHQGLLRGRRGFASRTLAAGEVQGWYGTGSGPCRTSGQWPLGAISLPRAWSVPVRRTRAPTAVVTHSRVSRAKAWLRATRWVSQPMTAGPASMPT